MIHYVMLLTKLERREFSVSIKSNILIKNKNLYALNWQNVIRFLKGKK